MIEKRKRGRPLAGDDKKTKMVCFWVTPSTRELIVEATRISGEENVANFCFNAVTKRANKILKV